VGRDEETIGAKVEDSWKGGQIVKKVLFILLALVLAVSVGLIGCAGGAGEEKNEPTGTLVIARASLAKETFLPWTGGAIEKNYLSGTIYEPLTLRDREGNLLPCLATNWEMSTDGKNWTVTIRQGIPFHDASGKEWGNVTAEDVKYTFERLASNGNNTWPSYPASVSHIAGGLQGILGSNITAAIEVVNNYTVKFKLNKADIAFMKTYTGPDMMGVVCKSYLTSKGDEVAATNPVGTGPYVKDSQVVGSYIQLRVVDNWASHWRFGPLVSPNPKKYFKYIKFEIQPDVSTRALGLINGDYQMVEVSPEVVDQIKADPNCDILPDIEYVSACDVLRLGGLNQLDTYAHVPSDPVPRYSSARPWANPTPVGTKTAGQLVRQALNLAINKTALLETIYEGVGSVAVASMAIPEWLTTLTPYPYDPTLAETCLDNAGYRRSAPGAKDRFSVTIIADERYSDKLVALAVESYWEAVGIDVTVVDTTWSALRSNWQKGGNTTGNLAVDPSNPDNPNYNYAWVHRTPPASGDPALAVNMAYDPAATLGDYTESAIDALRLAMLGELNPALRTQKLKDLGAYINDKACQVFLVNVYTPIGVRKELAEPRNVFDLKENPELIHRA
jgi:dipeptide transport system substrate-binding protein